MVCLLCLLKSALSLGAANKLESELTVGVAGMCGGDKSVYEVSKQSKAGGGHSTAQRKPCKFH